MHKFVNTLVSLEIWLFGIAIGLSIFSDRMLIVTLILAVLFWGLRWVVYGRPSVATPVDAPSLVLLLMVPVTIWATSDKSITLPQVYRLLTGIALMYTAINWIKSRARMQMIQTILILLGLLLAVVSPFTTEWGGTNIPFTSLRFNSVFPLVTSFDINVNVIGGLLAMLLPFPMALVAYNWKGTKWYIRLLSLLSIGVMAFILIATQSRGAVAALFFTVIIVFAMRWRFGWLLPFVGAAVVAGVLHVVGTDILTDLFEKVGFLDTAEKRMEIWSRSWSILQDFPFTGYGMGTFEPVVATISYPFFLNSANIPHAHNIYLQVALDMGIPGFVAWLAIALTVTYRAWYLFRYGVTTKDRWLTGLGAGMIGSQVAILLHGFVDCVLWVNIKIGAALWGVWGIILAGQYIVAQVQGDGEGQDSSHAT